MKASELRIGNKIIAKGLYGGKQMTVEQIGSKGSLSDDDRVIIFAERNDVGEFAKDCIGIPINEEWIIKFGFKQNRHSWFQLYIGSWYFEWDKRPNGDITFYLFADGFYETPGELNILNICQYVHQFQNLYFSLTGKELQIDLG